LKEKENFSKDRSNHTSTINIDRKSRQHSVKKILAKNINNNKDESSKEKERERKRDLETISNVKNVNLTD